MAYVEQYDNHSEALEDGESAFLHQRQRRRYYPERMIAEIRPFRSRAGTISEAIVVDFSGSGLGLLIPGKTKALRPGDSIQLRVRYDHIETRSVAATVVHRRAFGAFTHFGATLDVVEPDETFEAIELLCIERALFM